LSMSILQQDSALMSSSDDGSESRWRLGELR
jgi:hypothetical protein